MHWTLPVPRTFAPLWEVFRVSSDKLALCHLELTRKLHDLLKEVLRYGEEQLKAHKKVADLPGGCAGVLGPPGPQMSLRTHLQIGVYIDKTRRAYLKPTPQPLTGRF